MGGLPPAVEALHVARGERNALATTLRVRFDCCIEEGNLLRLGIVASTPSVRLCLQLLVAFHGGAVLLVCGICFPKLAAVGFFITHWMQTPWQAC